MDEEEEDIFEVEEILDHKIVKGKEYYYIHWKGFDKPEDNTWEPLENLENCLDTVVAYFLKIEKELPKSVTRLIGYIKESNDDYDEENKSNDKEKSIKSNSSDSERIKSEYKSPTKSNNQNSKKTKNNEQPNIDILENDKDYIIQHNSPNSKNDDFNQQKIISKEFYSDSPKAIEFRASKSKIYQDDEPDNSDNSGTTETMDNSFKSNTDFTSNDEESKASKKSASARSLWELYGNSFKFKPHHPRSQNVGIIPNNEVELDVAQICGRRQLNGQIEYLVEFDGIADRYCWIKNDDLNCDKKIRKFERKKNKQTNKPFDYFLHKYDDSIPHPSPKEISKAHENVKRLRKELLGRYEPQCLESPSKKKSLYKLLKIYEREIL